MHFHQAVEESVRPQRFSRQHLHEPVHAVEELTHLEKIAAEEPENRAVRAVTQAAGAGSQGLRIRRQRSGRAHGSRP
jgi:hypothetical protein